MHLRCGRRFGAARAQLSEQMMPALTNHNQASPAPHNGFMVFALSKAGLEV